MREIFPLTQRKDRQALVNAGYAGGTLEVAARAAKVQTPWLSVETASPDLKNHIVEIDILLEEMLQRVNVPLWSVEPTQEAWVEGFSTQDEDESLEDIMEVEVVSQNNTPGCCNHHNCKVGCLLCLLS